MTADLRADSDQLRQTVAELRQANNDLVEAINQFARVVHVLEVENQRLRDQAAAAIPTAGHSHADLRVLHPPPGDPAQPARSAPGSTSTSTPSTTPLPPTTTPPRPPA